MMARAKRAFAGVSPAVLIGATAAFAAAVSPAAAQDLGNPLGFLRELRELPLPGPNLLPGLQAPENPATPDNPPAPNPPDPAAPLLNGALRPGSDSRSQAGPPPAEPAGNIAAPTESAAGGDPSSAPSEQLAAPADPITDGGQPSGRPAAPELAPASADSAAQPADPAVASPGFGGPQDSGPGPSETISSHALRPLRLGVLAGRDVQATMAALDPVMEGLTQAIGRSVEVLPMASYRAMIDAQQSQRVDGGFYSAEAYARAQAQCRCLEPIVAPRAGDGTAAYYAIIVAAPESGIATVADLAGKVVAMGAADSVAARRMQLAALEGEGFDLAAAADSVLETASAGEAVRLVAAGEADAAFAWSSLEGDLAVGYSRGTLTDLVASGQIAMEDVAVVWRSPAISHGPVAVANALPEGDKSRLQAYLLGLSETAPEAYDLLNPFYSGGYVAVEPDDYRGLDALAAVELERAGPGSESASPDRLGEEAE